MQADHPEQINRAVQEKIQTLLDHQGLGVLATTDRDGHPYASLIAFAINSDLSAFYFVTPKATRKYANLAHERRVALLVNNSVNAPADFHEAMAVTVLGRARPVEGADKTDALSIYLKKHPYLRQFARSPSCALFAVAITGFAMVQQFQNVSELRRDDVLDPDA